MCPALRVRDLPLLRVMLISAAAIALQYGAVRPLQTTTTRRPLGSSAHRLIGELYAAPRMLQSLNIRVRAQVQDNKAISEAG